MRFNRELLQLVSNFCFLDNWGNWSLCRSVCIDRRLLVHQLILLTFGDCTLLTHLRLKLLQPLRKLFHCCFDHSSATMRGQLTERDYFLNETS